MIVTKARRPREQSTRAQMPLDTAATPGQVQARGLSPLGTYFAQVCVSGTWEPRNCDSPSGQRIKVEGQPQC